jgi:hypothetical protein
MNIRFRIGQRVKLTESPMTARYIPAGTTGLISDRVGWRAFEIICDGDPRPIACFPEWMEHIGADYPSAPAPSPFRYRECARDGNKGVPSC